MKALIIGATGATGKDLVQVLLDNPDYTEVVIFVRRLSKMTHPKLREILTDFDQLDDVSESIKGDVWFSCMGTTLRAAGSKEKQRHIDYGIPLKFAEIAKRNGVNTTVLLSAYGAAATSKLFYAKIKGQLEEKIISLAFDTCIIFKPGVLLRKDTDRVGERLVAVALKLLNGLGLARKFRPLPTSILAEKLCRAPGIFTTGNHVVQLEKIFEL